MKRVFYILFIIIFTLSSCVDDFEPGASSQYMDKIGYCVNVIDDSGEFKSRGESGSQVTVEKLDATIGDKDLYLHTVVTDSIPQAITARKHGKALSRGSITTEVDELAVSAVVINGSDDVKGWPATGESDMYMNNERVSEEYNWFTGRYWPQEHDSIRFFAYAPVDALKDESVDYQAGLPVIGNNKIEFYYKVNDKVEEQQDLLVSIAQYYGNYCKPAQINMSHALTAVEIQISEEVTDFTLTRLTVSNVKCDGLYTYQFMRDADDDTKSRDAGYWSDYNRDKSTYVLYENDEGLLLNGTGANMSYSGEEQNLLLMMIPQELPDDAKITVEGRDAYGNAIEPLSAVIGGTDSSGNAKSWTKGQHVVYRLSFNPTRIEYVIEVVPSRTLDSEGRYVSPYHGESDVNFTVNCFKRTISGAGEERVPLDWAIDDSSLPAWIDHITLNGTDGAVAKYSVLPNLTSSYSHNNLMNRTPRGTKDAPWDLSTNAVFNGSYPQNTANCYMVTAPGWYTLPLVYGNAITNGADNRSAYMGDINGSGPFRKGTDNVRRYDVTTEDELKLTVPIQTIIQFCDRGEIDKPWVTSANSRGGDYLPHKANIVWQDEPCLITDTHLNETQDYVVFRVPKETINEGNAVISVNDSTNVCWSWHIWVTDEIDLCNGHGLVDFSEGKDVPISNRFVTSGFKEGAQTPSEWGAHLEYSFNVMPSNLGACDADTKNYTMTTYDVNFKIIENGQEVAQDAGIIIRKDILKVGVDAATIPMTDNATYYQFGRKDPMIPGLGNNQDKPVYLDNRTKKPLTKKGGYQDVFYMIDGDHGIDNGDTISFPSISLHSGVLNPEYFFGGDSNQERNIGGLMYETWTTREEYNDETIPDFFINLWDGQFNDMPVFSHDDILNAVDYYNALKKALNRQVVKTVYDPCPVGYEMPRFDVYTGFSFDGQNVSPFLIEDVSVAAGYSLVDEINIDDVYPSISTLTSSGTYQGLKFFTKPMPRRQAGSAADITNSTDRIYIHALGHRNSMGQVASYNHFANALTATPLCIRWKNENKLNDHYRFQGSRLCVIGKTNYSVRSISTSSFDLAFPVIPAKSNCNPSTFVVDSNNSNIYWSDGNETNFSGSFN